MNLLLFQIDAVIIDYFFITLYSLSLMWTVACRPLATACYQHKARIGFAKSNHVNNRWLKGIWNSIELAACFLTILFLIVAGILIQGSLPIVCDKSFYMHLVITKFILALLSLKDWAYMYVLSRCPCFIIALHLTRINAKNCPKRR